MATLSAQLTDKLDASSLGETLLSSVEGPVGNLHAIENPVGDDELAGITAGADAVDLSSIRTSLSQLATRSEPLLESIGVPTDVMAPLTALLGPIREIRDQNIADGLKDLVTTFAGEIEGARDGGLIAALRKIADALSGSPVGGVLSGLLSSLTGGGGIALPTSFGLGDPLEAVDGSVRALGGMMALESMLADAERLARTIGSQLDADRLQRDMTQLQALLDGAGTSLPQFVSSVQADDPPAVDAAVGAIV